ncbi:MAG: ABC transporter ATP-binding protein [Anaerolineae bacterium]|nr:ABC transporter ATP-binding protein [Anaerolineae bacterium]
MSTIILQRVTKTFDISRNEDILTAGERILSTKLQSAFEDGVSDDDNPDAHEFPKRQIALDDLSLTIRDGETLAVLGPSGCGKTTLIKVIAGLIKPDTGQVLYDSVPIDSIPSIERGIGIVFQNYALYPHMIVRDNIGFFDIIHKQPERIPERIRRIVDVMGVDIRHLLSRKPPTLSGGEQQRVAVARCLARDPRIFLFDEPLSNLDAKLRVETRIQLKRLLRHYKVTSVYVTHDQTEAIALADRIAIMRDGKIEQTGTYRVLYETPRNVFVAQFFGTPPMNLFSGHITGHTWRGHSFEVSPIRPGLIEGQNVWLGIRPEHVEVANDGIQARVELLEPVISERRKLLYLTVAGQRCVASVHLHSPVDINSSVFLKFPTDSLYLFDTKTGNRIG